MAQEKFSVTTMVNNDGCFDLQFRKDTRHERTNSPTYYRWKIQFVVTTSKGNVAMLKKVLKTMDCGSISVAKEQARLSVQKIDEIIEAVIPFFTKHKLDGNKKKDFDLWQKAASIIYKNKGIYLSKWKKSDLLSLMQIHKSMAKYKHKPKKAKWLDMAQVLSKKV